MVHLFTEITQNQKETLFPPNFQCLIGSIFLLIHSCHPHQREGTRIERDNSNFLSFPLEISSCHLIWKILNQISCLPVLNINLKSIYQRQESKDPSSFTSFTSRDCNSSSQAWLHIEITWGALKNSDSGLTWRDSDLISQGCCVGSGSLQNLKF